MEQHGTAALVVDDDEKTLVYLEMVGHKQAVKANWAALMNSSRQLHYLGGCYIRQEGMKQHIHLKSSLPCGWANHILLHKQTSLKTMNPEHPFYLLDEGAGQGYTAWRALPDPETWQKVVQQGLAGNHLQF